MIFFSTIITSLVIILFLIVKGIISEFFHLASINRREHELAKIPVISVGKTANVLWAKNSDLVAEQIVLRASIIQIIFYKIRKILAFGEVSVFTELLDRAKREVILRMKESAKNADFIANLRFTSCNLKRHQVEIIGYATAVYMEEGADLPYQFATPSYINKKKPIDILKKLGIVLFSTLSIAIALYLSSVLATKHYKKHLTYEYEVKILKQIEKAHPEIVSNDHKDALKFTRAEKKLQKILDSITHHNHLPPMNLHLFSSKDRADIIGLPTSKILISWELISSLHSYEEINFIIANQVAHNIKKNYLKSLGNYLGASIILGGNNAMISDSFIAVAPIFTQKMDIEDEIEADKMAIEMLDRLDGHVGGALEFIRTSQKARQENNKSFMPTHPISKTRNISIAKLIKERNLRIRQVQQHSLHDEVLDKDDIDNDENEKITIKKIHASFIKRVRILYNQYRTEVFEKYERELGKPSNLSSIELLERNEHLVRQALSEIEDYKQKMEDLVQEYDDIVLPIANQVPEEGGRQRIFKVWWQKEKLWMDSLFSFYFKRDTEIFKIHDSEARFLKKRFGRYKIQGNQIILYDEVARSHYTKLRERLANKMREKFHENEEKITRQPRQGNLWDDVKQLF